MITFQRNLVSNDTKTNIKIGKYVTQSIEIKQFLNRNAPLLLLNIYINKVIQELLM